MANFLAAALMCVRDTVGASVESETSEVLSLVAVPCLAIASTSAAFRFVFQFLSADVSCHVTCTACDDSRLPHLHEVAGFVAGATITRCALIDSTVAQSDCCSETDAGIRC